MTQGEFLAFAVEALERLGIPYMVVGSFTSAAYGEPRFTNDIDIVIDVPPGHVDELCAAFGSQDFYVSREAAHAALAQRGQFNVIHPESGNKIDFMISRTDAWGIEQLQRRQRIPLLPDLSAFAARPEDVIISKMLYYQEGGSEKHLRDIAGILRTSGPAIDRNYVDEWTQQFGLSQIWNAVQAKATQSDENSGDKQQ
jgi:hypothetical protein